MIFECLVSGEINCELDIIDFNDYFEVLEYDDASYPLETALLETI